MGFAENMRIMSGINCTLASLVSYGEQKQNGASASYAGYNFLGNMLNGFVRNDIAYQMQNWGNPMGNMINMYSGYGNPISNFVGTTALLGANCSPWMFFGMCQPMCYMPMSFGCFF